MENGTFSILLAPFDTDLPVGLLPGITIFEYMEKKEWLSQEASEAIFKKNEKLYKKLARK